MIAGKKIVNTIITLCLLTVLAGSIGLIRVSNQESITLIALSVWNMFIFGETK